MTINFGCEVNFTDLRPGDVFLYGENIYMALDSSLIGRVPEYADMDIVLNLKEGKIEAVEGSAMIVHLFRNVVLSIQ